MPVVVCRLCSVLCGADFKRRGRGAMWNKARRGRPLRIKRCYPAATCPAAGAHNYPFIIDLFCAASPLPLPMGEVVERSETGEGELLTEHSGLYDAVPRRRGLTAANCLA